MRARDIFILAGLWYLAQQKPIQIPKVQVPTPKPTIPKVQVPKIEPPKIPLPTDILPFYPKLPKMPQIPSITLPQIPKIASKKAKVKEPKYHILPIRKDKIRFLQPMPKKLPYWSPGDKPYLYLAVPKGQKPILVKRDILPRRPVRKKSISEQITRMTRERAERLLRQGRLSGYWRRKLKYMKR